MTRADVNAPGFGTNHVNGSGGTRQDGAPPDPTRPDQEPTRSDADPTRSDAEPTRIDPEPTRIEAESTAVFGMPSTVGDGFGFSEQGPPVKDQLVFGAPVPEEFAVLPADEPIFGVDPEQPVLPENPPDLALSVVEGLGNIPLGMVLRGERDWDLRRPMPGADAGSGGSIWLAADLTNGSGEVYVIKTIPAESLEYMHENDVLQRRGLHKEMAMRVDHPHIGEIVDFGKDNDLYFLVSPLYEPGSLSRFCRAPDRSRNLRWCCEIIVQVLDALDTASRQGYVHLDIKPGNLVLDGGRIRVIDWGLSRRWQDDQSYTFVPRGTAFYASPEQILRPHPGWDTPLADLYGTAAVFYWLITNEPPLAREVRRAGRADLLDMRNLFTQGVRPRRVDELLSGVPRELGELIDRWLSYTPEHRITVGTAVDDALARAKADLEMLLPRIPLLEAGTVDDAKNSRR